MYVCVCAHSIESNGILYAYYTSTYKVLVRIEIRTKQKFCFHRIQCVWLTHYVASARAHTHSRILFLGKWLLCGRNILQRECYMLSLPHGNVCVANAHGFTANICPNSICTWFLVLLYRNSRFKTNAPHTFNAIAPTAAAKTLTFPRSATITIMIFALAINRAIFFCTPTVLSFALALVVFDFKHTYSRLVECQVGKGMVAAATTAVECCVRCFIYFVCFF